MTEDKKEVTEVKEVKKAKKEKKKKKGKEVTRAEFDAQASKIRRMSDNFKRFAEKYIGSDAVDGKLGKASILAVSAITIVGMAVLSFGTMTIVEYYDGDSIHGTYKVVSDEAGAATLTVDEIAVLGDISVQDLSVNDLSVTGLATVAETLGVTGITTLTGGAVIADDIDVNLTDTDHEIRIDQTNGTGTATEPLIEVTDARTGSTANTAAEATLVLTGAGTHTLNVTAGITVLQALTQAGAITQSDSTASSSKDTGAIVTEGGIGVEEDVYAGGNMEAVGTFTGASSDMAGEVEAGSLDLNLTNPTDYVRVDQTNAAGTATEPLIEVTDARTGDTANTAAEATLVITPSGTHAVNVTAGISALQAVTATTVDADSYTVNAGQGISVATAGALKIGAATTDITTSIDYGSTNATAHTFTSDSTGNAEVVLPNQSIGGTELTTNARRQQSFRGFTWANADGEYFSWKAPVACTIVSVELLSATATTGSDQGTPTSWEFDVDNITQTATLGDPKFTATASATNEVAANTLYALNTTSNLTFAADDIMEVDIDKNGSPTDLSSADTIIIVEYYTTD